MEGLSRGIDEARWRPDGADAREAMLFVATESSGGRTAKGLDIGNSGLRKCQTLLDLTPPQPDIGRIVDNPAK
jgi:hypothetical protein